MLSANTMNLPIYGLLHDWNITWIFYFKSIQNSQSRVLSHGDEVIALTATNAIEYAGVHDTIRKITEKYGVDFQVCGAFAAFNGLSEGDFPSFIDVVPYGPSSISDYRSLKFELIDLELTW